MKSSDASPKPSIPITFRIPGQWSSLEALAAKLPLGARLDDHHLHLDDVGRFEWNALKADDQFLKVFADACTRMPSERDREIIENYTVNFCLTCPGGSIATAQQALKTAAVVLRAGGAGVFVDNSCLAHGSDDWHMLAGDETDGGVFWALVTFIRSNSDIYSMGMHTLGHRDAIMPRTGNDERDRMILASFLGYAYRSGVTLEEGEIISDPTLPSFQLEAESNETLREGSPMFNPFGQWRLKEVAVE